MKRILALLLAALMLVSCLVLASCGDEEDKKDTSAAESEGKNTGNGNGNQNGTGENPSDTFVPTLEDTDRYSGEVLRVLVGEKTTLAYALN